jgi:hypothetical protein
MLRNTENVRYLCGRPRKAVAILCLVVCASAPAADFFPRNTFESFWQEVYSGALERLGEGPFSVEEGLQLYRFLYLPSFGHEAVVLITNSTDEPTITAKYFQEDQIIERSRKLTEDEWRSVLEVAYRQKFWVAPKDAERIYAQEGLARSIGLSNRVRVRADGERWVVEASNGQIYHVADAWSPESGPIYSLGRLMSQLAGIEGLLDGG